ncbi:MAG: biotin/lipoyl-binding protein, partial [Verrucomicrobiaceae bacterium]
MEILLLAIYAVLVWLIFIKLKLLPWNIVSQVIVVTIPIVALTALILFLNVIAPSTHDVRVVNYYVQIIPQISGRVIEVPVEGNRPVKEGDILFRIDPSPFQDTVRQMEAKVGELKAKVILAENEEKELIEQLPITKSRIRSVEAALELTNRRVKQFRHLAAVGAGRIFDAERAETDKVRLE